MNDKPIGVFDSGLGGLTVVASLKKIIPQERIIYFADTAHVPYGERPLSQIRDFAVEITGYLIERGAKMVVMACNMSSAVALESARLKYPSVPILGMIESGAKAALQNCYAIQSPRIGVLATTGTVNSGAYTKAIQKLNPSARIFEQPCPLFVPLVEEGKADSIEAYDAARQYTARLVDEAVNAIILGCTHYPYLIQPIREAVGPDVLLIDPANESALEAKIVLGSKKLLSQNKKTNKDIFIVSGSEEGDNNFISIGSKFLGSQIELLEHVEWGAQIGKVKV